MLQPTSMSSLTTLRGKTSNRFTFGTRPRIHPSSFADTLIQPPTSLPHETEDTVLTGGTRSLNRRLLALNLEGTLARRTTVVRHETLSLARSA